MCLQFCLKKVAMFDTYFKMRILVYKIKAKPLDLSLNALAAYCAEY